MYRFQPLLFQPVPSLAAYSVSEVVEEVRATYFPDIEEPVEVRFAAGRPLACIHREFMGRGRHLVVFHPVLNHPQTPREVVQFIAKHELTHARRPPRVIDGYYVMHPPEFWEHEAEIGPEHYAVWAWVEKNLSRCLAHDQDGTGVRGNWRAFRDSPRIPYTPSLPFEGDRWEQVCPEGGAQLRLPPDWVVRPRPFETRRRYRRAGSAPPAMPRPAL